MLVVDEDQASKFQTELHRAWDLRQNYTILTCLYRRGVPFARHVAKTLADQLGLQVMFFRDDDITATFQVDKHNHHQRERDLTLAHALQHLRHAHSIARCRQRQPAPDKPKRPIVVGCSSNRHRTNLNQRYGSLGGDRGWSFSNAVDFRFVMLDLRQCRRVSFINEHMRQMTSQQWQMMREQRKTNPDVQIGLFQSEDFGFCEQLCALHNWYPQSICLNYIFASSPPEPSAAETIKSRYLTLAGTL